MGALANLAVDGVHVPFERFEGAEFRREQSDGGERAIRGTLDHIDTQVVAGRVLPYFKMSFQYTKAIMDVLLPLMGFTDSGGGVWVLGDVLPPFPVALQTGGREYSFGDSFVGKFEFYGQKGTTPPGITLHCASKSYAAANTGASFGALAESPIYNFSEAIMNIQGSARKFDRFRLAMNYRLLVEHNNSVFPTHICPSDHQLSVGTSTILSTCDSSTDLLNTPMSGDMTGSELDLTFSRTVGAFVYTGEWYIPNVKSVPSLPNINKADYVRLPQLYRGYATASNPSLTITNTAID